ncbi:MAG TPA: response regulator [Vicinamibacterales bacterium]|jgi:FixJ family two-component response regulator|nr:response regulator [Vicinamibacterales bacterium]
MPIHNLSVAVVEDDESVRKALGRLLSAAGYRVALFESAEAFLADDSRPACLVLDVKLPGISGLELERRLRVLDVRIPILFVTAMGDDTMRQVVQRTGRPCLPKPIDDRIFLEAIARVIGIRCA